MATDVVERAHLPVAVAHQHDFDAGCGDRHRVAGIRQIVPECDRDPSAPEDALALEREEGVARVCRCRQSACRADRTIEISERLRFENRVDHRHRTDSE